MSRLADIALPEAHVRRLSATWLVIPLLLVGVWEFMAPRVPAVVHHPAHAAASAATGHGVAPLD